MSQQDPQSRQQALDQLVARCWADPNLLARLQADPAAVLPPNGIQVPEGVEVSVLIDTPARIDNAPGRMTVVIPQPPRQDLGYDSSAFATVVCRSVGDT